MAVEVDLKSEREPIALVRTPEGDKRVLLSEAKGKVDIFDQLPDYAKREFSRKLLEKYRKWEAEQKIHSQNNREDK